MVRTMPGQRQDAVTVLRRFRLAGEACLPLHLSQPPVPLEACLGAALAVAEGKKFTSAEVPQELAAKREKVATRVEKRKADIDKPVKVNKAALGKKIKANWKGSTCWRS